MLSTRLSSEIHMALGFVEVRNEERTPLVLAVVPRLRLHTVYQHEFLLLRRTHPCIQRYVSSIRVCSRRGGSRVSPRKKQRKPTSAKSLNAETQDDPEIRGSGGDSRGNGTFSRPRERSIALLRFRGGTLMCSVFRLSSRTLAMQSKDHTCGTVKEAEISKNDPNAFPGPKVGMTKRHPRKSHRQP